MSPLAGRSVVTEIFRTSGKMAEAAGFEPAEPEGPAVFKTAAFGRSATPPR